MEMVQNGKGTTAKGGFYQKDEFHIIQEITRDVPEKYRNEIYEKTDVIPNGIDDYWFENHKESQILSLEVESLNPIDPAASSIAGFPISYVSKL